jgi:hypothetical protein
MKKYYTIRVASGKLKSLLIENEIIEKEINKLKNCTIKYCKKKTKENIKKLDNLLKRKISLENAIKIKTINKQWKQKNQK